MDFDNVSQRCRQLFGAWNFQTNAISAREPCSITQLTLIGLSLHLICTGGPRRLYWALLRAKRQPVTRSGRDPEQAFVTFNCPDLAWTNSRRKL